MSGSSSDRKLIVQAILFVLAVVVSNALTEMWFDGRVKTIIQAFIAAVSNAMIYLLQHFDAKTTSLNTDKTLSRISESGGIRSTMRILPAVIACAACCCIVLLMIQTAGNVLLSTIKILESENQLRITDYGWQVVGNTALGLMLFLTYLPAISIFAVKFGRLTGWRMGIISFVLISFLALGARALQNYGSDLLSTAPTMSAIGASIRSSFSADRDKILLLVNQFVIQIAVVLIQAFYMLLCTTVVSRLARRRGGSAI